METYLEAVTEREEIDGRNVGVAGDSRWRRWRCSGHAINLSDNRCGRSNGVELTLDSVEE
jgi:hypothetical protein